MQFVDVGVYRVHLCDCRNKGVSLTYIHMERSCYASWKDWVELIIQCFFVELSLVMSCTTFAVTSSLGYSWCVDGRSCVFYTLCLMFTEQCQLQTCQVFSLKYSCFSCRYVMTK